MAIQVYNNNEYIKILLDGCYINKSGITCSTRVYLNILEREKEKNRNNKINIFKSSIIDKVYSLKDIVKNNYSIDLDNPPENVESVPEELELIIRKISLLSIIYYDIDNYSRRFVNSPSINTSELSFYRNEVKSEMEILGFKDEWITDPVVLVREDQFSLAPYQKQDFSLESFYNILKHNYEESGATVEDV